MKHLKTLLTLALTAFAMAGTAQETFDVTLYNSRPTYDNGDPKDTAKVRVYLPKESEATGRAVVICPGGGYEHLALKKEGYDWGCMTGWPPTIRSTGTGSTVRRSGSRP